MFSTLNDFRKSKALRDFETSIGMKTISFTDWFKNNKHERQFSSISRHLIHILFLQYVTRRSDEIAKDFSDLPLNELSLDHTFKIPMKIKSKVNNRYKPPFSTLVLAMNERNCVNLFTLCKSKKLADIEGNF